MVTLLSGSPSRFFLMTDKIVVLSTCVSEAEAEKVARLLIDARLAACVNVVPRMRSFYRWKGEVETAEECLLIIKTARSLFGELRLILEKNHTYEVPEAIALAIVDGSENYMNWLKSNLRAEPESL
jgi:periplasmic divalent cation tolerance protein